ncbi:MAG: transposase domain-containing protein [Hyphomicrobiaceae bacterium]
MGSDNGGRSAAITYTVIATAQLNDIEPPAWLSDVLSHIAVHRANRINELLTWQFAQNK